MSKTAPLPAGADPETLAMLADSAADFCARSLDLTRLRALRGAPLPYDRKLWGAMCELGWSAILVPEDAGGLGLGATAVAAVCRQLGQVVAPEPMLECGVGAAAVLAACPDGARLLGTLIDGTLVLGADLVEAAEFAGATAVRPRAEVHGDGYRLAGRVPQLPLGGALDGWLVNATLDGATVVLHVPATHPGVRATTRTFADGSRAATVAFDAIELPADALLARGAAADAAFASARGLATLATSAYLVGLAERLFELTLDYLKARHQFGRPIGAFQALQHRAVDLYVHKTLAAAVVDEALAAWDRASDEHARLRAASRAKYRATEAALLIARQAVQLHGAIGYTDECDVGLYLNRALVLAARHGNASFHAGRLHTLLDADEDESGGGAVPAAPADGDYDALSDEDFRRLVRDFFESAYPSELRYPSARLRWEDIKPWYLELSRKGWVAPAWPRAYGGMGLSPAKLLIYIEEQERWGIGRAPDMGIQMVGPLLIHHGSEDQRARYLPKILSGEHVWCQGYSEPNAGSDLASLRTEAIADGDEFVLNGQKTWTTLAQDATHMFCLARTATDGKPQAGISFFLIDFKQPGVTIRPIRNIAGHEEFCEVFLDNVRVPADCLVGGINRGWTIAKALLGFERIFIGSPKQSQYCLKRLEALAGAAGLYADAAFVDRLTRLKLDVLDLESTYQRFADIVRRGEPLGPDVSLLKIWSTETFARLSELMVEAAGADGAGLGRLDFGSAEVDVMSQFYNARPATIYGGSNEIQRNIIAKNVLALPG